MRAGKNLAGGFKLGVCDWTIGKTTDPASLEMAKRIGLDGVQVDCGSGKDTLPCSTRPAKAIPRRSRKAADADRIAGDGDSQRRCLQERPAGRAAGWASASTSAKALGVKVVLVPFFGNGDLQNDDKGMEVVIGRLKKVAPKAEKAGVTLGIESWLSAQQHIDIIERVGSPAVKVYYDVANSHKAGYDIYKEIRRLGKLICEFHAKDYDDLYGKGSIDFGKFGRQWTTSATAAGWLWKARKCRWASRKAAATMPSICGLSFRQKCKAVCARHWRV